MANCAKVVSRDNHATNGVVQAEWSTLIGRDPSRHCALIGWIMMLLMPAFLCHKDTAQGINFLPFLCFYGIRELASATPRTRSRTLIGPVWSSFCISVSHSPSQIRREAEMFLPEFLRSPDEAEHSSVELQEMENKPDDRV